ncbi:hypothetical protein PAPYR_13474 [Paratrimastix pyriformis]|uniref:CBS domain-containing protein n=1 Tax=Paratrimastix pyriformis TaxID=342808 RepID=A0ABQ8U091_9EUKA|nr:hypothetical protein PAPYR_13474 [Paratrimastix pyriformis]
MSLSERAQPPTSLDRTPVVPLADKDRDYFYVICGHKNPDPDSVCSAIGYAELKYLQHPDVPRGPNVVGRRPKWAACRCGESNARIDAILKRFGVEDPPLYSSITPRLKHIMTMAKQIVLTYKGTTCAEVMQIMERCGHHILPVIDPEKVTGRPFTGICGAISFDSLGLHFLPRPGDLHSLKRVTTSVDNIVRSLNAKASVQP